MMKESKDKEGSILRSDTGIDSGKFIDRTSIYPLRDKLVAIYNEALQMKFPEKLAYLVAAIYVSGGTYNMIRGFSNSYEWVLLGGTMTCFGILSGMVGLYWTTGRKFSEQVES